MLLLLRQNPVTVVVYGRVVVAVGTMVRWSWLMMMMMSPAASLQAVGPVATPSLCPWPGGIRDVPGSVEPRRAALD